MKLTVIALLAIVGFAAASCPNQCSGHGRCGANDKCACYEQTNTPWGQRNGWTGADCSLRSCPLGVAFDQLSNHDDRLGHIFYHSSVSPIVPAANNLVVFFDKNYLLARNEEVQVRVAVAGSQFQWKWASDEFYQQPITMAETDWNAYLLTDHTASNVNTGIRLYFTDPSATQVDDVWTFKVLANNQIYWVETNDNTLHQMTQCSGRGACNQATGRCECFVGYNGEACQRTSCPNDCSGHGVCQDQRRFAADASKSYEDTATGILGPYDANKQMGCLCDLGFRGPDCSMIECPSGADPLGPDDAGVAQTEGRDCSGRGICNYGSGQCECFRGYFGERCETQSNFI